jgi:hypothetical protein
MSKTKVPRLTKGKGIRGPDYYGCLNTGMAPAIINSSIAGRYLVGPELYITTRDFAFAIARQPNKRKFSFDNRVVQAFKTRKPAVDLFQKLCHEATERNDRIAAEHKRDQELAANGDMAAVSRLLDY